VYQKIPIWAGRAREKGEDQKKNKSYHERWRRRFFLGKKRTSTSQEFGGIRASTQNARRALIIFPVKYVRTVRNAPGVGSLAGLFAACVKTQ
jgi:hypothetical protein